MAKLSRQTKEIIKTVLFLLVVGVLIFFFIIYPLTRAKVMMGRVDIEDFNPDSLAINDPGPYAEIDSSVDTFYLESDGLTTLACLYLKAPKDSADGTAILLHRDGDNRDSLLYLAQSIHNNNFNVITYDQRASRFSTGKYRGEGYYESSDIEALISYLELREKIIHPLYVIGFETGADGAILAAHEEKRINGVIAIDPYLTTMRMQDVLKDKHDAMWFPFYRSMMWWWYNIRSGYAAPYRKIENLSAVTCTTLILLSPDFENIEEITKLKELSPIELLTVKTFNENRDTLSAEILDFIKK